MSAKASDGVASVKDTFWCNDGRIVEVVLPGDFSGLPVAHCSNWTGNPFGPQDPVSHAYASSYAKDAAFIAACWNFVRGLLASPSLQAALTGWGEWKRIEDAPRNSASILLGAPGHGPCTGWWDDECGWVIAAAREASGKVRRIGPAFVPTCWQHVPSLPSQTIDCNAEAAR